jgi:YfiH family protein
MGKLTQTGLLTTVSGLAWPGVDYFCTTRMGGASKGHWAAFNLGQHVSDDPGHVAANRQLLRAALPGDPLWLEQVHGAQVFDADTLRPGQAPETPPVADAAITARQGRVLAIMTADCLPVVMACEKGTVLGVAHAGWRGLAAGVLEHTLEAMRQRAPEASRWRAWIGPSISQAHFEVGEDVYQAFVDDSKEADGFFVRRPDVPGAKWLADLPALARLRLTRAGVHDVELSGQCTYGRPELYYSYRRDATTGRIATLAWLHDSRSRTAG